MKNREKDNIYKIIPLRGVVTFPNVPVTCDIGKETSKRAIKEAVENNEQIVLALQSNFENAKPSLKDINHIACVCDIKQAVKGNNDITKLLAHGVKRVLIKKLVEVSPHMTVEVEELEETNTDTTITKALLLQAREKFMEYASMDNKISSDVLAFINSINLPNTFIDSITAIAIKTEKQQIKILNEFDTEKRLEFLIETLSEQIDFANINKKINNKIKGQMDKAQKDYYLREQMKAISEELGEESDEYLVIENKIKELEMPKEVEKKASKELRRVRKMPQMAPENTIIRNYLDVLTELPWRKKTRDNKDLIKARKILDEDHSGLEKVKDRIVEHLAVMQLTNKIGGEIICFVGPPGVGKTSIAKSIARALNRKFVKMAVGGVKDESEIRGHRRTYVGAMPGRIMYNMKLAGTTNPVFLIDEIDKMASDHKGDPASAMLEVLDPEQNKLFRDNFLEVPYDLSDVMFIATANNIGGIPAPLRDRMEIISLSSYTASEKFNIAKNYLIPKMSKKHGFKPEQISITDEALNTIIESYTYEAGVRGLEREIAKICRKVALKIVTSGKNSKTEKVKVAKPNIKEYLGASKIIKRNKKEEPEVGSISGLTYSAVGGDICSIEVNNVKGDGKILLTGNLGDVMKESAQAGLSAVKRYAKDLGIAEDAFKTTDIHVHVPEGAVPKDGPSAGGALATAIASAFTGKKIDNNLAMTGEVTIRGNILAIGGLKEKLFGAMRSGITRVIIPKENGQEIEELPEEIKKALTIVEVENIREVFKAAFIK